MNGRMIDWRGFSTLGEPPQNQGKDRFVGMTITTNSDINECTLKYRNTGYATVLDDHQCAIVLGVTRDAHSDMLAKDGYTLQLESNVVKQVQSDFSIV